MKTSKKTKKTENSQKKFSEEESSKTRFLSVKQVFCGEKREIYVFFKVLEKEFFEKTGGIYQKCKDRDIKFFICLGDPWISEEHREEISQKRQFFQVFFKDF